MTPSAIPALAPPPPLATDAVLARLWALHPKVIDLSLERIERLLAALGNPERRLPPVVHVAGTNGKGSVIAFLRGFLEAAGLRAHVYTSPHLVRFNERIRVAGSLITDAALEAAISECEAANAGQPITFFEITTAAAILAGSRVPADVTLLETGLGGRLDATNIVDKPLCTVITNISRDHIQFLGESLAGIAFEKAGILKRGVPAVIGPQPDEALPVLVRRAAELNAAVSRFGTEWNAAPTETGMTFTANGRNLDLPKPGLAGLHQVYNAATAIACLDHLPFNVDAAAVRAGLAEVDWPGRLQKLAKGPLVEKLRELAGPHSELWLDGGHNPAAGAAMRDAVHAWGDMPVRLVFGMLNSKDGTGFLRPLADEAEALRAVAIPGEAASLTAEEAAAMARAAGHKAEAAPSLEAAVADLAAGGRDVRILICGSLYLAGRVLADNA